MKAHAIQIRELIKRDKWSDGGNGNSGSGQGSSPGSGQGGNQGSQQDGGPGGPQGSGGGDHNGHGGQPHPSHPGDNEEKEGAGSFRQGDQNRERQNPEQEYLGRTRSGHEPHRDSHGDQNQPKNNN